MEFGYPFERPDGSAMHSLVSFGFVVKIGPRVPNGSSDVYGTGIPRQRFYYPALGVFKHSMLSNAAGDINLGKRVALFQGGRKYIPPHNDSKIAKVLFAARPSCWDMGCRERLVPLGPRERPLPVPACTPTLWGGSSRTGVSAGAG